jgi:hypothetical protein
MADERDGLNLFGFTLTRNNTKKKTAVEEQLPSVVPPTDEDGAGYVTVNSGGGGFNHAVSFDNNSKTVKDDKVLIMRYRDAAMHPEIDQAINHIVNEAVSSDHEVAQLNVEKLDVSNSIKKKLQDEFDGVINMLDFNNNAADMFRRFYIDGRLYHHLVIDPKREKLGIQEMRYIDSINIRKVKEVIKERDPRTDVEIVTGVKEYYVYEPNATTNSRSINGVKNAVKLSEPSVSYVTSGIMDSSRARVIGHLDKALKPLNQLRMMEDAQVIYRISRAPERRIFYVDTGTMPTGKADEYIKDLMAKYRNKMTYDVNTGQLSNDSRTMTMMEDFFLGRREGGRGTEISTLPGGQNLGEIEDIIYFQKRLYKSLNVPLSRLEQEAQFSLGRSSELTRDEQFFQKFVNSIRNRFGKMFIEVIGTQCVLKSICTKEEWNEWKSDIFVEFLNDNYFTELKNAEIVGDRIERLDRVASYVGEYFSREWVMKEILMMSDDDITAMNKQMKAELGSGEVNINTDVEAEAPVEKEAPAEKEAGPEIDVTKTQTQNEMKRLV